ncbi:putative SyrP-like protein [Cupriavidus phytorum]|uniref:SyrP-like protein n=2 Tax=Cupriavidus TaxID=106589 RepID=A0A976ABW1_9BURK|nr:MULTISPECIES: TauD/TfdA family dioxygenase [Cupriavidus]MCO4862625.1 TauD/TfdA family dioxygenase [Cupriavidus sp. WGlv3]PZX26139.1 TfdA family taurine catabolism dioxygenase TauD [Cupriavidus alkaliphilus]SOY76115.1 putative SyrP-like protein [Cupriavidus taiwanensis]
MNTSTEALPRQPSYATPTPHPSLGDDVVLQLHPKGIPMFVMPASERFKTDFQAFRQWFVEHEDTLDELLRTYGALRFRGFPIRETEQFAAMTAHYPPAQMGYTGGGTPRAAVAGKVFESTRVDERYSIRLHQEMSYLPHFPYKLAFYSKVPATTGGATSICDIRKVEALAPQALLDDVERRGVMYRRNFRDGSASTEGWHPVLVDVHRSWQDAFGSADKAEVQSQVEAMGLQGEWLPDGSLQTTYVNTGFVVHPVTRERHWFNQINQYMPTDADAIWPALCQQYGDGSPKYSEVRYGDGEPIPLALLHELRRANFLVTVDEPWLENEVMILDNIICCHGRQPYTGKRETLVQLFGSGSHD